MDGPRTIGELGEDRLIELFAAESAPAGSHLLVPNGDDAAMFVVEPKYGVVITTDSLVEGTHFDLAYCPAHQVGRKLMSVNLSDVAAMGARPCYALLSVHFPPAMKVEVAQAIAAGIREQARAHGVAIIGGNTTRTTGPIVLCATLLGRVEPDEVVRRRGTVHQDGIYVTGRLGDANAGLRLVNQRSLPPADHPLFSLFSALVDPVPRVEAGRALAKTRRVHAMCDVSDGLGRDLRRLLAPEGLGARIEAHQLPISRALAQFAEQANVSAVELALRGGEDYELLFTADPEHERALIEELAHTGTPVARIGTVTATPEIEVVLPDGTVGGAPSGFDHFDGGGA